jgi:hypothetical protein
VQQKSDTMCNATQPADTFLEADSFEEGEVSTHLERSLHTGAARYAIILLRHVRNVCPAKRQ